MMRRLAAAAWVAGTLLGCAATGPAPDGALPVAADVVPFTIDGLVIHNGTAGVLQRVTVLVPATGRFVSCGTVLPGSDCATTFPATTYEGHAVRVDWQQGGESWTVGPLLIDTPAGVGGESSVLAEIIVTGPGAAGARFVRH